MNYKVNFNFFSVFGSSELEPWAADQIHPRKEAELENEKLNEVKD